MASPNLELLTPAEYLKRECAASEKSEYYEGVLVAMAGAQLRHNIITRNVLVAMTNRVKGSPCQAISQDMRVRPKRGHSYMYPDIVVYCGEPELEDEHVDTLLNPVALLEVLSPSTGARHRCSWWLRVSRKCPGVYRWRCGR